MLERSAEIAEPQSAMMKSAAVLPAPIDWEKAH